MNKKVVSSYINQHAKRLDGQARYSGRQEACGRMTRFIFILQLGNMSHEMYEIIYKYSNAQHLALAYLRGITKYSTKKPK